MLMKYTMKEHKEEGKCEWNSVCKGESEGERRDEQIGIHSSGILMKENIVRPSRRIRTCACRPLRIRR